MGVVRRLVQRDNMDSLAAACPGLSTDLVAQAFLTRPELLLHLIEPETLTKVGEEHPSILEAAHNLAAAVHEEQSQGAGKEEERSTGGSYYLDEMSDEEMEEDGGGAAGPSRGQPGIGQPAAAPLAQTESAADFTEQVARMREMGIVDEGLALRALQIMGGDLQAAVDLIFSGWEGEDEAMQ